ncbi:hypothetical protein QR680_002085 [Steinernema hermaphroditum]|uniref:Condensin complex subunit 1 C-terminal domain-containing protein n=1 Tax=Steinernema hermaphroditum TaxID=289476 RepID=A0AA39H167_9BILA|nr:hypothetical protein QR680_002085 [Steinernema hermaphroditum]
MEPVKSLISVLATHFLSVGDIPDDVVDKAFESLFGDYSDLGDAAESTMITNLEFTDQLESLTNALETFLLASTEPIFDRMSEEGVPAKKLVTLAWMAMEESLKNPADIAGLRKGVQAARMYTLLCCLPGAGAFEIYSKFLYLRVTELARHIYRLVVFKQPIGSIATPQITGRKKKISSAKKKSLSRSEISPKEQEACRQLLRHFLDGVFSFVGHVSLFDKDVIVATALLLRDIILFDLPTGTKTGPVDSFPDFLALPTLGDKCFGILHRLMDDRHPEGRKEVMGRVLLPRIMCYGTADEVLPSTSIISSQMIRHRDAIMAFLTARAEMDSPKESRMIYQLVQNTFRCPDRSDYKARVSEGVISLLRLIPTPFHYQFVQFMDIVYSQPMGSMRSFLVEVLPQFINSFDLSGADPGPIANTNDTIEEDESEAENSDHPEDSDDEEEEINRSSQRKRQPNKRQESPPPRMDAVRGPVDILLEAMYDKSSSIRARAVLHLGDLLRDAQKLELIQKICADNSDLEEHRRKEARTGQKYPSPLLLILLHKCDDEKVAVRKSALVALGHLFPSIEDPDLIKFMLNEMADSTRDMAISVRKQAAETLSEVYKLNPGSEVIRTTWLESVMPLLIDREQSVQQMASKIVMDTIFAELTSTSPNEFVWMVLSDIEADFNLRRLLYRAMRALLDQGLLPKSLVKSMLCFAEDPSKSRPVWLVLSFLAKIFPIEAKVAFEYWLTLDQEMHKTLVPTYVINVLVESCTKLKQHDRDTLMQDLKARIVRFDIKAHNIPAVFYLYAKLNDAIGEEAKGHKNFLQFCKRLVTMVSHAVCEAVYGRPLSELPFGGEVLSSQGVSQPTAPASAPAPTILPEDLNEETVVSMLQIVGECVQYEPKSCTDKLAKVFKYIFASEYAFSENEEPVSNVRANMVMSPVRPSQPQSQAAQVFLREHRQLGTLTTRRVRAACAVALCRICLQNEKLAKEVIPVFARELRNNRDHIVRNNLIVGIADLCVRYTLMVDRYSTVMALCLTDASVFVRQQTITLLTILIKEQYLKCEGQILYKLIGALIDDNKSIRDYLNFCLVEVLLVQFPEMFFHHFVQCVFYFNGIDNRHMTSEERELHELEKKKDKAYVHEHMKSNLQGHENFVRRMRLYRFMLGAMNDVQRFAVWARLIIEVAQPISDGIMDYKKKAIESVLIDTLNVMCCEQFRMHSVIQKKQMDNDLEPQDDEAPPTQKEARFSAEKARCLRMGIGEMIIPGMLSLRGFLTEKRSPILKLVMNAFMVLVGDYEEQVDTFFANDRQVKAELLFDIRCAKENEQKQKQEQEMTEAVENMNVTRATSVDRSREVPSTPLASHLRAMSEDLSARRARKRKSSLFSRAEMEKSTIYAEDDDENPLAEYTNRTQHDDDPDSDIPSRASILTSPTSFSGRSSYL